MDSFRTKYFSLVKNMFSKGIFDILSKYYRTPLLSDAQNILKKDFFLPQLELITQQYFTDAFKMIAQLDFNLTANVDYDCERSKLELTFKININEQNQENSHYKTIF